MDVAHRHLYMCDTVYFNRHGLLLMVIAVGSWVMTPCVLLHPPPINGAPFGMYLTSSCTACPVTQRLPQVLARFDRHNVTALYLPCCALE